MAYQIQRKDMIKVLGATLEALEGSDFKIGISDYDTTGIVILVQGMGYDTEKQEFYVLPVEEVVT